MDQTLLPVLTHRYPYVKVSRWWNPEPPVPDVDQIAIDSIIAYIVRWCEQRNFIISTPNQRYRINLPKNQASFRYQIYMTNMRRMVIRSDLNELLKIAADNSYEHLLTEMQALSINLIVLHDPKAIDCLINRLYNAYATIPVPSADMTWDQVHQDYPFFWIILAIHTVLMFYTDPADRVLDH